VLNLFSEVKTLTMRIVKLLTATTVGAGLLLVSSLSMQAKPEYSKAEKKPCTTCHVSNKSKELNDVGKKYKETHKLPADAKK
jgi:hypothetical protein